MMCACTHTRKYNILEFNLVVLSFDTTVCNALSSFNHTTTLYCRIVSTVGINSTTVLLSSVVLLCIIIYVVLLLVLLSILLFNVRLHTGATINGSDTVTF